MCRGAFAFERVVRAIPSFRARRHQVDASVGETITDEVPAIRTCTSLIPGDHARGESVPPCPPLTIELQRRPCARLAPWPSPSQGGGWPK